MKNMIRWLLAILILQPVFAETLISEDEAQLLAEKIWLNEGAGKTKYLTHWNEHEDFSSLGIGHFIWYPAETTHRPYQESFPALMAFVEAKGMALPIGLTSSTPCPWPTRAAFYNDFDSATMTTLRTWLAETKTEQAEFIALRLQNSLPKILAAADDARKPHIQTKFNAIASTANGVYALTDYTNFKGEGVVAGERYQGYGWGMLQVLDAMPAESVNGIMADFAKAADFVLTRRVLYAPKEESQWLAGWRARLKTYLPKE